MLPKYIFTINTDTVCDYSGEWDEDVPHSYRKVLFRWRVDGLGITTNDRRVKVCDPNGNYLSLGIIPWSECINKTPLTLLFCPSTNIIVGKKFATINVFKTIDPLVWEEFKSSISNKEECFLVELDDLINDLDLECNTSNFPFETFQKILDAKVDLDNFFKKTTLLAKCKYDEVSEHWEMMLYDMAQKILVRDDISEELLSKAVDYSKYYLNKLDSTMYTK